MFKLDQPFSLDVGVAYWVADATGKARKVTLLRLIPVGDAVYGVCDYGVYPPYQLFPNKFLANFSLANINRRGNKLRYLPVEGAGFVMSGYKGDQLVRYGDVGKSWISQKSNNPVFNALSHRGGNYDEPRIRCYNLVECDGLLVFRKK